MNSKKSHSQFVAEQFVMKSLMMGASLETLNKIAQESGMGRWVKWHVAKFVKIEIVLREQNRISKEAHDAFLASLPKIHGFAWEKGKFGSKRKTAYRFWLNGRHIEPTKLVYIADIGEGASVEQAFAASGLTPAE